MSCDCTGFTEGGLRACCGGGGPYNVNLRLGCGYEGAMACKDPSLYVSWDGLHFTEAAYRCVATTLLRAPFTIPQFHNVSCFKDIAAQFSDT